MATVIYREILMPKTYLIWSIRWTLIYQELNNPHWLQGWSHLVSYCISEVSLPSCMFTTTTRIFRLSYERYFPHLTRQLTKPWASSWPETTRWGWRSTQTWNKKVTGSKLGDLSPWTLLKSTLLLVICFFFKHLFLLVFNYNTWLLYMQWSRFHFVCRIVVVLMVSFRRLTINWLLFWRYLNNL